MGDRVWFCSSCGDGPIPAYQNVCVTCSHQMCGSCRVEDSDSPVPDYNRPPTQSFPSTEEIQHHRTSRSERRNEFWARHKAHQKARAQALAQKPARTSTTPHFESEALSITSQTTNLYDLPRLNKIYNPSGTSNLSDEDTISAAATSPSFVFSTDSLETSATTISKESGFSIEQIQTATRVFLSLILSDPVLRPLYEAARSDPSFGARELCKCIRATLKRYAEDLRGEAKDHLEFSASQLVRSKAGYAARCIGNNVKSVQQSAGDSSDDETQPRPVDERQFADNLDNFQSFLSQSNAFANLRVQTREVLSLQPTTVAADIDFEEAPQPRPESKELYVWVMRFLKDTAVSMIVDLLISLECFKPEVKAGWTRIFIDCHVS